jgi:hypothetical protein
MSREPLEQQPSNVALGKIRDDGQLHCGELADPVRCREIPKARRSRHSGRDLLEQLQLFRTAAILEGSKSSEQL